MVWVHTRNGKFSVKCVYFVKLFGKFTGWVGKVDFGCWGIVWGLNLPPKLGLFIWKVIHRILAIKEELLRRKL